jgi:hypothetical protein
MRKFGFIAAGIGALILLGSFKYDAAPDGTYNIGLLQAQMMIFWSGGIMLIAGIVAGAVGHGLVRMEQAGIIPPAGTPTRQIDGIQPAEPEA